MIRRFLLLIIIIIIPVILLASQQDIIKYAEQSKLYHTNQWKALLHYNQKFDIEDNTFILSKQKTLKSELLTNLRGFYQKKENFNNLNEHPICRFPARFLFITHELNISRNEFPDINCPDFEVYKKKAPADNISLIFASEKVSSPSSMMGHTFLKYRGKNYQNIEVEHAVSFYTIIETVNIFKLAYQNIFSGMKGLFALQPYRQLLLQYTQQEHRNIWEYQLKLSPYERKLIYYHIWELKDIDMKYFFTSYNCSTVIYYTLSLVNPKIYEDKKLWITPLDTVKFLYKYDLIQTSKLLPSDEWLVKMIEENTDSRNIDYVKRIITHKEYSRIEQLDFYALELLNAYSTVEYNKKNISKKDLDIIKLAIDKTVGDNNLYFDISKYKSPNKIPHERQAEVAYSNVNNDSYIKLSFLGASHLINDNNREYFGESELKIGYLSLLVNKSNLELNEFTLYSMKSYIPYDTLTKDLSYQFELAIKKEYTKSMQYLDTMKVDGGVGIDFLIAKDINMFLILNGGIGYNKKDHIHFFFNPEVGAMIYEVFNMKSYFSYQPVFINTNKAYDKYTLRHNIFFNKDWTFSMDTEAIQGKDKYLNYGFSIKKLF